MSNLALLTIVLRIIRNPMLTIILGIFTCDTHDARTEARQRAHCQRRARALVKED
jgi:hypothetical protein